VTHWDAVVVGAGPAGSATALLLARAGARVLLLDRARFPRDKPCSEYLSPETTRVLARLGGGVLEAVAAASHARLTGMKVVAPSGAAMIGRFGDRFSFALPRTSFDTILLRAAEAAGAELREGVKVEELVYDGGAVGGVVARTGAGRRESHHARVVVGADGLRSVVARRLGGMRSSLPRRVAFAAHVADVAGVTDVGEMHIGRPGYVGLGPIGDGVTTVALVLPLRSVRRDPAVATRFFEELDRFPRLAGRFGPRRLVRGILATGPFAQWSRRPVAPGGGALLVGDAADFFDPFTGQGIYSALRGAELAAAAMLDTLATGASLRAYARARRHEFTGKWLLERLIALGVGWPALAEGVVGRLARRPDLADLLVRATGNCVPARRVLAPGVLARLLW
jgi:geranylgeranyl reductase family protein